MFQKIYQPKSFLKYSSCNGRCINNIDDGENLLYINLELSDVRKVIVDAMAYKYDAPIFRTGCGIIFRSGALA